MGREEHEHEPARADRPAACDGDAYDFLFIAKGGGSANKTFLFQETREPAQPQDAGRVPDRRRWPCSARRPARRTTWRLSIGGTSAEANLKTVKLASTKYLDHLPTTGNEHGRAFRDLELEAQLLEAAQHCGIGAQFGGKYFALDVRVIRLAAAWRVVADRHGSLLQRRPAGQGQDHARWRVFLEQLEFEPLKYIPEALRHRKDEGAVRIDLNRPMREILAELTRYPVTTRLLLDRPDRRGS